MRKRFRRMGIGVTLVVGIACWYGSRDRLNLLDRSTRITSVRGWGLERPDIEVAPRQYDLMAGGAQYQWVGNRQILCFHDLKPIRTIAFPVLGGRPNLLLDWPASVGTPTLYDVSTHSERPLPQLSALFRDSKGAAKSAIVSPDGSRLLWQGDQGRVHIALLDGSHPLSKEGEVDACWSLNPQQFYTYAWSQDARKKDVIAIHSWDVKDGASVTERLFAPPKNYALRGQYVLMPDGSMVTNSLDQSRGPLTLYRILPAPASLTPPVTPDLPSGAKVDALIYSPQGDRLAWIITRTIPSPLAFLKRVLPTFSLTPHRMASLWVSGAMGEDLHEIGHIPVRAGGRQFFLIDYVRWQSDGKTLSFVSNGSLYTVPAR